MKYFISAMRFLAVGLGATLLFSCLPDISMRGKETPDSLVSKSQVVPRVLTIPAGTKSISKEQYANGGYTAVVIPSSVTSIGSGAFKYNELTSVIIPNSVTSIGNYAFYNQSVSLVEVTVPEKLHQKLARTGRLTTIFGPDVTNPSDFYTKYNSVNTVVYIEVNNTNPLNAGSYIRDLDKKPFFDTAIIFAANIVNRIPSNFADYTGEFDTSKQEKNFTNLAFDVGWPKTTDEQKKLAKEKAKNFIKLALNKEVAHIIKNKDKYIKPLQNKGIKVLLSITGHHQRAGIANFQIGSFSFNFDSNTESLTPSSETDKLQREYELTQYIKPFVRQIAEVVKRGGFDGVDFDDEYSKYHTNGSKTYTCPLSFPSLITELRQQSSFTTDKIISLYFIGDTAKLLVSYTDLLKKVIKNIDYIYNNSYLTYRSPTATPYNSASEESVSKYVSKNKLSAAAVQIHGSQATSKNDAASHAESTINDGYGAYMMFNLTNKDWTDYLSAVSEKLYFNTKVTKGTSYSKDY